MKNKINSTIRFALAFTLFGLIVTFLGLPVYAENHNEAEEKAKEVPEIELGKKLYNNFCKYCHGEKGDGNGSIAFFLNIKPRDFRMPRDFRQGVFKFKSSSLDEIFPFDKDLYATVNHGLGGTAMPGLHGLVAAKEIRGVVEYVKTFSAEEGEWETPEKGVDYGDFVPASPESIITGRELFLTYCSECHGKDADGVTMKKLKDDWGRVINPRNLTKNYDYRRGNTPGEIYIRITAGIPGTPMPSFADPAMRDKKLSNEQRWHIANYVSSLAMVFPEVKK